MIRSNPADRVERPRKEKFKSEIYSGEELEQLFKAIQGDPSEFGVIMAAFYGLRRSEVVGLKWDAIDFENKTISIQHMKKRVSLQRFKCCKNTRYGAPRALISELFSAFTASPKATVSVSSL